MSVSTGKPHILQIIKGLDIGNRNGGAEKFAFNLSCLLSQAGYEVIILAIFQYNSDIEKKWCKKLLEKKIKIVFFNPKKNFYHSFKTLIIICRSKNIQIIHSHNQLGSLITIYLKTRKIVKYAIRTAHTYKEWGNGIIAWICRQLFSKWLFPIIFDVQVGVSQSIVDQFKKYPGVKISHHPSIKIFNGISSFRDINGIKQTGIIKSNKSYLTIGSIGPLVEIKCFDILISAMPDVLNAFPHTRLILIGEGEQRLKLEGLVNKLNLSKYVFFKGQVFNVRKYLRQMDLFILPSRVEGLPTVILESMASGVPVIASDIPGVRELIIENKTGWLFNVGDVKGLSTLIIKILQKKALREKVAREAKKQISNYSMKKIWAQYEVLYSQLLRRPD